MIAAGIAFAIFEKILFAASLLVLFAVVRSRWGTIAGLITLALTAWPSHFWRISDDFEAEPLHRVIFLLAFACTVGMRGRRSTERLGFALLALFLVAAHLKVQWYVAPIVLLPVLLLHFRLAGAQFQLSLLLCVATALIPLSIVAVNWIGWQTTGLSPGLGLHVNLKHNGAVLREFSDTRKGGTGSALADQKQTPIDWWNIHVGPDVDPAEYAAFDRPYLLQREIARRKTFAIISHPDAGKTTLTEKLLLYGGAIQLAGAVKAKRGARARGQRLDGDGARARHLHHVERAPVPVQRAAAQPARHAGPRRLQRGHLPRAAWRPTRPSCCSTAPRASRRRPRSSSASASMRADAHLHLRQQAGPARPRSVRAHRRGRGGARHRRLPDHLADPRAAGAFRGVYHRERRQVFLFELRARTAPRSRPMEATAPRRARTSPRRSSAEGCKQLRDDIELLEAAGDALDQAQLARGEVTPMFFGSAHHQLRPAAVPRLVLRADAAARAARASDKGPIAPDDERFTALRLQDPGEHGPGAPRPHRVPARLLGPLRARDEGAPRARSTARSASRTRCSSSRRSARSSRTASPATSSASSIRASS